MENASADRRRNPRYGVRLAVHYHVSQKGRTTRTGTGITANMSSSGVSFRCRKPLPVGAHVEMVIDWPAKYVDLYPVDLLVTGFVVRSDNHSTAIRMTSRKFRVAENTDESIRASA